MWGQPPIRLRSGQALDFLSSAAGLVIRDAAVVRSKISRFIAKLASDPANLPQ
jgi:hypothetical protein